MTITTDNPTVDELLVDLKKQYGEEIGGRDLVLPDVPRVPTGILALDIATGGGLPMNRLSIIYGPYSGTKTNTLLCAIREHQRLYPDKACVILEPEGRLTRPWIERMGVDAKKLVVLHPDYAEQCADITEKMLYTPDIGLLGIDSIAAMLKMACLERSAEDAYMGGNSMAINRMVNACTLALVQARKGGRCPTLIWINQIRYKIGQAALFGSPETLPGGQGQLFMSELTLRVQSKPKKVKAISSDVPVLRETTARIVKYGVPIIRDKATYDLVMVEHDGLTCGRTSDFAAAKDHMEELGLLKKAGKGGGYLCMGEKFKTLRAAWEWVRAEKMDDLLQQIVEAKMLGPKK